MERWRWILLIGIILGNVAWIVDSFVISIPYVIMIPLLVVAIMLIFTGFIIRRSKRKAE